MNVQPRFETTAISLARPAADPFLAKGWTQREYIFALIATSLFWLAAALRWPIEELIVPWDSKTQFYAFFRFLGKAAELGSTPYWNPFHYGGHPSIADPQSLIFNPLFRLLAFIAPKASMFLFDFAVQLHLLIGGLSLVLLSRRFGLRPTGAILAAIIFMLGGSASSRLQHVGEIMSYAAFPLALLMLDVALVRRSFLSAIGFGLVAGIMALGRDQVAYLCCIALLSYAVLFLATERPFMRTTLRTLPVLLLCGLVGFSVIIVPILLTLQFADLSNRPEIGFDIAAMGSLYPPNFVTLFAGNVFATYDLPYNYFGPGYETRALIDSTDRAINYLFAGTLTPLVCVLMPRTRTRAMNFCLALFVASIVYAIGNTTPVFRLLYDFVPGVELYRRPADATFIFNIALGLLAGAALSRFETYGLRRPTLSKAIIAGLLLAAPILMGLHFAWVHKQFSRSFFELVPALFAMFVATTLFFAVRRAQARFALAILIILATGIELNLQNAITSLNAEPRDPYADLEEPTGEPAEALAALDAALKTDIERKELRSRTEVLGLGGSWQNIAMVQGFESTNGYNPLRDRRLRHHDAPRPEQPCAGLSEIYAEPADARQPARAARRSALHPHQRAEERNPDLVLQGFRQAETGVHRRGDLRLPPAGRAAPYSARQPGERDRTPRDDRARCLSAGRPPRAGLYFRRHEARRQVSTRYALHGHGHDHAGAARHDRDRVFDRQAGDPHPQRQLLSRLDRRGRRQGAQADRDERLVPGRRGCTRREKGCVQISAALAGKPSRHRANADPVAVGRHRGTVVNARCYV